jgi:short-subunit dehydrogenase
MPVAFITGASSGIGEALSRVLADRGYDLALFARSADKLDTLAAQIRKIGRKALPIPGDVANLDDLVAAKTAVDDRLGPVNLVVANAGVGRHMRVDKIKIQESVNIMRVNVIGAIHTIETFLPDMLKRGQGQIAGIASLAGYRGLPQNAAYSGSKAALITYLDSLRAELRPRNIFVTTVCPGFVATPMTAQNDRMPFLWTADKAAARIVNAIERHQRVYRFPLPMSILLRFAQCMPNALFDYIMKPRNRRPIHEPPPTSSLNEQRASARAAQQIPQNFRDRPPS